MFHRPLIEISEGPAARLCVTAIGLAGELLAPVAHRGFWRVCNRVGKLARGGHCVLEIGPGSAMKIHLEDPYWSQIVASAYRYEPELAHLLGWLHGVDYSVVDCGANYGYWSILASSPYFGARPVVAIEASAETFAILADNRRRNGDRFTALHRAVFSESGRQLSIDGGGHANRSVLSGGGEPVTSITIDDAVRQAFGAIPERTLIKLDVEGAEIDALAGAGEVRSNDALIVYEDHGGDPSCRVTEFVIDQLGLEVYFIAADGSVARIRRPRDANRFKRKAADGYNFCAARPGSELARHLPIGDRRG